MKTPSVVSIPFNLQTRQRTWLALALFALMITACAPLTTNRDAGPEDANGTPSSSAPAAAGSETVPASGFDPAALTWELTPVVDGLERPVFVTHAADGSGRLFVIEQPGTIRIVEDGVLLPEPFLDIREQVNDGGNEQGLLGLAFAPDYEESGYFFVNYTVANNDTVIARFQVWEDDANRANPASEHITLTLSQPARNHNGGMLVFGPDGYLWIGTGDGGASGDRFGNGQNPATLLGKMLRIDVTSDPSQPYLIPPDNPWVSADWNGADVRDEVWAMGLRNPWRYSFDRMTGDLWIGDVGQNVYEEINYTPASDLAVGNLVAQNFGWPIMEGLHCFAASTCEQAGLTPPVAEYDHSGHCSVTGGYVYRGQQFPALNGIYFYADYCSGVIWALIRDADGGWQPHELMRSRMNISSFGEDEGGELYITDLRSGVYRLEAR